MYEVYMTHYVKTNRFFATIQKKSNGRIDATFAVLPSMITLMGGGKIAFAFRQRNFGLSVIDASSTETTDTYKVDGSFSYNDLKDLRGAVLEVAKKLAPPVELPHGYQKHLPALYEKYVRENVAPVVNVMFRSMWSDSNIPHTAASSFRALVNQPTESVA